MLKYCGVRMFHGNRDISVAMELKDGRELVSAHGHEFKVAEQAVSAQQQITQSKSLDDWLRDWEFLGIIDLHNQ